jgi:hypothetical protein
LDFHACHSPFEDRVSRTALLLLARQLTRKVRASSLAARHLFFLD